jgi:lincosamide nucleotidyltransferase A/C/D/E
MTADEVDAFLGLMDALGVRVWLDGGWAVDACLGAPTRRHGDLDIVIEQRDVATVVSALQARAYAPLPRADTRPWNFVMADDSGRQIDFHVIVLDERGHGVYGPPQDGECYRAEALAGTGTVKGRRVRCITPEWLVRFHTGYDIDETDWADVSALCKPFDIPVPQEYIRFTGEPRSMHQHHPDSRPPPATFVLRARSRAGRSALR